MEIPPYFDQYVTAEISRVSGQIDDLEKDVTLGLLSCEERWTGASIG